MSVIDTHSHIYSEQFDEDRDEMIQRAFTAGVEHILMPNVDLDSIAPMLQIEDKYPGKCFSMMGLHPTSVDSDFMQHLDVMEAWFQKRRFYAVGEIGLDLYWDKTYIAEQVEALKIQIDWAKKYSLPVVLHVREAFDQVFEVLDSISLDGLRGVCHSFTGNIEQANKFLAYGCFKLGINGVLTFKNSGLGDVVKQLSLDDLVLETDAPYLTPVPYRGKRNEPMYVQHVKSKVAELFRTSEEEVGRITSNTARRLFDL